MRFFTTTLLFVGIFMLGNNGVSCNPYIDNAIDNEIEVPGSDGDDMMLQPYNEAEKRGCVPRGDSCDQRPHDCCYNSSCRCNLWGSNCRCQRMGLFQKWG